MTDDSAKSNPYWMSTRSDSASTTLTMADIEKAMDAIREQDQSRTEERAYRMAAWVALDLDYDAMTPAERYWCALGMEADAVHPEDMKKIEAVVEKYRRG